MNPPTPQHNDPRKPVDPSRPILFFWISEEGETYAAHDKESARLYYIWMTGDEIPEFTEENKGVEWGEESPDSILFDEDGETPLGTFMEEAQKRSHLPYEIATTYR